MLLRTSLLILTILALTSVSSNDKDLKRIIKDSRFSKIPKNSKNIKTEIINEKIIRYGYLFFESEKTDIITWIKKTKLGKTNALEVFEKNIFVDPRKTPKWATELKRSNSLKTYYSQRQTDNFTTFVYFDTIKNSILIEYQRKR